MKTSQPLISVIVPVYNAEKYVDKCLESIRKQTYKNIEVIIINDGSLDRSKSICERYVKEDKRFTLINQTNQGASVARNNGLACVKGDYVAFVDADDWLENNFYEVMYSNIRESAADIVVCDFWVNNSLYNKWNHAIIKQEKIFDEYLDGKIMNRLFNKLYKKEVVENVFFPENRDLMEDGVFMVKVLSKANIILRLEEGLYHYREVPTSLMHSKRKTEGVMLGYFANVLERLSLLFLLCPNKRNVLLEELLVKSKSMLTSGYDLARYDIYLTLQREICIYKEELEKKYKSNSSYLWLIKEIQETNDWGEMRKKYLKKCIFSNYFTIKDKVKVLIVLIKHENID